MRITHALPLGASSGTPASERDTPEFTGSDVHAIIVQPSRSNISTPDQRLRVTPTDATASSTYRSI